MGQASMHTNAAQDKTTMNMSKYDVFPRAYGCNMSKYNVFPRAYGCMS